MSGRKDRIPVACPNCGRSRELETWDAERAIAQARWCYPCAHWGSLGNIAEAQAYVDEMAVERLLTGMPVNSTRAERQAAVDALTARHQSARIIAERLRVTQRTVERLRARQRVSA